MSKERYFELYKQFVNHTISKEHYEELMLWVADEKNDIRLRTYMERLWMEDEWAHEAKPEDWNEFKNQFFAAQNNRKSTEILSIQRILSIAAAVLLLVVLSYGLYQSLLPNTRIYQTAYGETQVIELDDGSMVRLNANSTLTWNEDWKKSGVRKATLNGEAFFDVHHTVDDYSFIVETNDLKVKVLGTSFNVQSRHDKTDVILQSGKIVLDLKRSKETELEMEPGDRVDFSAGQNTLHKEKIKSIGSPASWLDGVLRFEDVSVAEMFLKIKDLYGKELITQDKELLSRRMFTGIPYEDWDVVKQALELALGVNIDERGNDLYVRQ